MANAPGSIRDSIIGYLTNAEQASIGEIQAAVTVHLGSVRQPGVTYEVPERSDRTGLGRKPEALGTRSIPVAVRKNGSERAVRA